MDRGKVAAWKVILHQLCPRCRAGTIFRKSVFLFPAMRERCPTCDLKFEREEGYFLGAMYIGYALALGMIPIFGALLWTFPGCRFQKTEITSELLFFPFAPRLTLLPLLLFLILTKPPFPHLS